RADAEKTGDGHHHAGWTSRGNVAHAGGAEVDGVFETVPVVEPRPVGVRERRVVDEVRREGIEVTAGHVAVGLAFAPHQGKGDIVRIGKEWLREGRNEGLSGEPVRTQVPIKPAGVFSGISDIGRTRETLAVGRRDFGDVLQEIRGHRAEAAGGYAVAWECLAGLRINELAGDGGEVPVALCGGRKELARKLGVAAQESSLIRTQEEELVLDDRTAQG